ncbi:MAG: CRISPR-associated protein Csm4 [Acidobacteriota bacterium]|jgi:CRISPR-associated protein Csm4|nr:CRISPR-associated protein Csm4 [Acidobacteriota bacterium]
MQTARYTIHPRTAFGTPLAGDTLFGQACWTFRHRLGDDWLTERLQGYGEDRPFLVLSDAFPQGFLPLPTVPSSFWETNSEDRKALKKKRWLPMEELESDFRSWQRLAYNDTEAADAILRQFDSSHAKTTAVQKTVAQPHNTINRLTGTTGKDMFAPYSQPQIWFHPDMRFDLHAVFDEARLSAAELLETLAAVGLGGFGRDASIGLGKFDIEGAEAPLPETDRADAWLTLAPCAPQGQGFDRTKSFYHPLTRFGRHGDVAALSENPFKRPLLLARTGAVFTPQDGMSEPRRFIGQGLNGVSFSQPEAVAQGYAPVVGIKLAGVEVSA